MSNRDLKLKLWNQDRRCFWCKRPTILTNNAHLTNPDPLTATIDHVVSRFDPRRWVHKKKKSDKRKVLACYECNHNRNVQETLFLSRGEVLKRSRGYSLSPKGKPITIKPLKSVKQVLDKLNNGGNINT